VIVCNNLVIIEEWIKLNTFIMERREFLRKSASLLTIYPSMSFNIFARPSSGDDVLKIDIGKFQCTIFQDSMFKYLAKDFFINAPGVDLQHALKKYNITPDNIPSPFIATLLQQGDKKILIDTGVGFAEQPVIVRGKPVTFKGRLHALLAREDVKKEDITDVIITHFHPDHVGGIFNENGTLNFPNAKFHMHADEWNFWHTAASVNQPDQFKFFIEKNITPLKSLNLQLINGDFVDLLPGIIAVKVDGHTPGQIAVIVRSEKSHLLYVSDAILHPIHIERLDWQTNYDLDHTKAKQSRIKLLELAYKDNMLINAFHFDFPGLGRAEKSENNWRWNTWSS
jgi:glyoxylase-like metal-dependent hydrolase (beta-lactamase superfamily II)